jgi:uncharacterized membrane protein
MSLFNFNNNSRKPRRFHHEYIYVDERKEKLQKIEEDAKRDLGLLPPKERKPEDIRGTFINGTKHLKRKKERGTSYRFQVIIVAIIALSLLLNYLMTGKFGLQMLENLW